MTDGSTIILDATTNTVQLKEAVAAPASGTRTFSGLINVAAQPATLAGFGDLSLVTKGYASASMSVEVSTRLAADTSIAANLSSELVARSSADASIASGLSSELVNRAAAVSTEASLRTVADASIATNLSTEKARIDAILLSSDADKDSFAEIVSLINSVDTTNDEVFAGYVLSNNAALSTEVENRQNADESLAADLGLVSLGSITEGNWVEYNSYIDGTAIYYEGVFGWEESTEYTTADFNAEYGPSNLANFEAFMSRRNDLSVQDTRARAQGDVDAEQARAESAELSLSNLLGSDLSTEISNRIADVDAEESRALSAELVLTNDLSAEASSRVAADASLASDLSSEISRATEAEGSIAIQLSSEVSYIIANTDLTSIDSFAEVVADMSSEVSTRYSIDEAIKAGVNAALAETWTILSSLSSQLRFKRGEEFEGDGSTTDFSTFIQEFTEQVFLNGLLQREGYDYTVTRVIEKGINNTTFSFLVAPDNDSLIVVYGQHPELATSITNIDNSFTPLV
jgi:hypothetical protein